MSVDIFNQIKTLSSNFIIVFQRWNLDFHRHQNITMRTWYNEFYTTHIQYHDCLLLAQRISIMRPCWVGRLSPYTMKAYLVDQQELIVSCPAIPAFNKYEEDKDAVNGK